MRVAWAGSCSRSSVDWRPGNAVSASKTTRCSGSCQRCARSCARIVARPDPGCVPGAAKADCSLHSRRRILDSRSSISGTSCERYYRGAPSGTPRFRLDVMLRWRLRVGRNRCGRWLLPRRRLALVHREVVCCAEFWRWHGPGRTCLARAPQEAKK
jgi:hypothetical protein